MPSSIPRSLLTLYTLAEAAITPVGSLIGRGQIIIQNNNANPIYFGFSATGLSATTGAMIASGGSVSLLLSLEPSLASQIAPAAISTTNYPGSQSAVAALAGQVYAYSTAGTATNAVVVVEVA